MSDIRKILAAQERQLLRLEEAEVRAFLRAYHDARRELRERLEAAHMKGLGDSWTAQHTRAATMEVESGIAAMQSRLDGMLGAQALKRSELALGHMARVFRRYEAEYIGVEVGINLGAMRRLTRSGDLLLHRYSTSRYSADLMGKIQAELARSHAARLPRSEVVKRIVGLDESVFSGMEHRAALIDRMENTRAYDSAFRAGLEEAHEVLDEPGDPDPLLKKAIEFIDKRSHPFSAAVDGRVAHTDGEWEVPAVEVRKHAQKMGKGVSGILWPSDGTHYRGATYPAHFNDRGRGIPWRVSWGSFVGEVPARTRQQKARDKAATAQIG